MYRDFTYIDDLVESIRLLIDKIPYQKSAFSSEGLSDIAPFRIINIGNSDKVHLLEFVEAIEKALNKKAIRNYMDIQLGDVTSTWANTDLYIA